jgi:hypothetical protein
MQEVFEVEDVVWGRVVEDIRSGGAVFNFRFRL